MTSQAHHGFRSWARTILSHRYAARYAPAAASEVYQTSTMAALLDGIYDGDVTIAELLAHGDFGLGTFNGLDGEMIILDGRCYHLHADGKATIAVGTDRTPFAAVTYFKPEITIPIPSPAARPEVTSLIDTAIKTANLIQAIRIEGTFSQVRTRTVTAQARPYPPMTEATANEPITNFSGIDGTLAGYRTPDYEQGISVAGYHLHFIDESRTCGGHCLDFEIRTGEIKVSTSAELHLSLPQNAAFLTADLSLENVAKQIRQTEGG
jgi:acetolactate decarboxylase